MTPQTLALSEGLALLMRYALEESNRKHAVQMAELQASTLRHMVDAVFTRRISVVEAGFKEILAGYDAQARHYMAEQSKFNSEILNTSDTLKRTELKSKSDDFDTRLAEIRADARLLYAQMGELLLALGGQSIKFLPDGMASLGLGPKGFIDV